MNSVSRRVAVFGIACVVVLCSVASQSFAAVFGQNPFVNTIGAGGDTITSNSLPGAGNAYDGATFNSIFIGAPGTPLFYQQTWTAARDVATVFLDTTDRDAGGNIYVATTSGGPVTTLVDTFSMGNQRGDIRHIQQAGIFGVKVEVNSTTSNNYQLGEIEFDTYHPASITAGATSINSVGSAFGNMTDHLYFGIGATEWRANPTLTGPLDAQFTGWEFAPGVSKYAKGVRVVSSGPHGPNFVWSDWDLQLKLGGIWTTIGRAAVPAGDNVYWVDLGGLTLIEGVRLFGSTAGGNNPTANGGLIIDEIYAFIPEPGSAMILAIAGVILMKRRSRHA